MTNAILKRFDLSGKSAAVIGGGGDLSMTIPYEWQLQFNASDVPVIERIQNPVPKQYFDLL
jgi:hypothetical protein